MICNIDGDSIAKGLAQMVHECRVDARVGAGSAEIVGRVHDADLVVISAGSNDETTPKHTLIANLKAMRAKVTGVVLWILPRRADLDAAVRSVASVKGDLLVSFATSCDLHSDRPHCERVHPVSYVPLAKRVRLELAIREGIPKK